MLNRHDGVSNVFSDLARHRRILGALAGFALAAVPSIAAATGVESSTGSVGLEFDFRDNTYVFGVPDGELGPWKSDKLDALITAPRDVTLVHIVSTNRLAPGGHGEFARVEDDHRFGTATVRLAVGAGGGVLGQRTVTVGVAQALTRDRRLAVTGGIDLTELAAGNEQRVLGIGPEAALGRIAIAARYFRATTTKAGQAGPPVPSSGTVAVAIPAWRNLAFTTFAFFGGEVNADRTSSFLPTSSGRFGTDLALAARVGVSAGASLLVAFEGARYRGIPTGAFARMQHVLTIGVAFRPSAGSAATH